MRWLFDIVKGAVRRPFRSWTDCFDYLIFLGVCVAGVASLSWLWIAIGGTVLFLTTWPRYRDIYAQAARIDGEWRELGWLERAFKLGSGLRHYARASVFRSPSTMGLVVMRQGKRQKRKRAKSAWRALFAEDQRSDWTTSCAIPVLTASALERASDHAFKAKLVKYGFRRKGGEQ